MAFNNPQLSVLLCRIVSSKLIRKTPIWFTTFFPVKYFSESTIDKISSQLPIKSLFCLRNNVYSSPFFFVFWIWIQSKCRPEMIELISFMNLPLNYSFCYPVNFSYYESSYFLWMTQMFLLRQLQSQINFSRWCLICWDQFHIHFVSLSRNCFFFISYSFFFNFSFFDFFGSKQHRTREFTVWNDEITKKLWSR